MDLEEEERPRPNRCTKIVYFAWKIFTCLFTHVMLVTAVVAYCIAGAYAFSMLEKDHELAVKRNISLIRGNVTLQLWTLTKDSDVLYEEKWRDQVVMKLKEFEGELVASMKLGGWDGKEGEKNTQWTFHGALFYSIIVITTIGYGHIAPKTEYGKVTTIMYAIVGIPLMLLCLSNIGDIMANSFRFLYWRICCYACTQPPKRSHSHGHSQHRRGRSVRSTVRSHGAGGRASGRSRTSSLRKPHGSQRSADSALALSEMTHSYSDTECRYYDEGDDAPKVRGSNKRQPGQHRNSDPQNSAPKDSEDVKNETPVLFNKYALDREESCRVNNKMPPRIVTRSPVPSRKARAQTAEPCSRPDMYLAPPLRSSSLRQTYPGRREVGSERGYRHRTGSYDYNYDYNRDNYKESNTVIKPVPIWLCMFLVISYIIGGAFLFHGWEGWSFADSAYFCFITLTTIGFGDFVPAQKMSDDAQVSIALCSLYLLFGIALLAMSFNLVQEEVISNVKSVARNLGILKDESDDDYYY